MVDVEERDPEPERGVELLGREHGPGVGDPLGREAAAYREVGLGGVARQEVGARLGHDVEHRRLAVRLGAVAQDRARARRRETPFERPVVGAQAGGADQEEGGAEPLGQLRERHALHPERAAGVAEERRLYRPGQYSSGTATPARPATVEAVAWRPTVLSIFRPSTQVRLTIGCSSWVGPKSESVW